MTPKLAFHVTIRQVFSYLALLVGLSGALETYALHIGGPGLGVIVGDALQGAALVLFLYNHVEITGQPLSFKNVATILAVVVGASGAIQAYIVHVGGTHPGLIAGAVLQGLALLAALFQQVQAPKVAAKLAVPHG